MKLDLRENQGPSQIQITDTRTRRIDWNTGGVSFYTIVEAGELLDLPLEDEDDWQKALKDKDGFIQFVQAIAQAILETQNEER